MVNLFDWHCGYSVGLEEFDEDHKRLFELANSLVNLDCRMPDPVHLAQLLDELIDYAESHFQREEAALRRSGYPGISEHQRRHREFLNALLLYKGQYRTGQLYLTELAHFVVEWILMHEEHEGRRLKQHLTNSAAS